MYASAKIKNATSNAPHICLNVFEKTCFRICAEGRKINKITSQDASIDVPPVNGAKLNVEASVFPVTEDLVATDNLSQLIAGRGDHG
jgi:hypothetical protein